MQSVWKEIKTIRRRNCTSIEELDANAENLPADTNKNEIVRIHDGTTKRNISTNVDHAKPDILIQLEALWETGIYTDELNHAARKRNNSPYIE